MDFITKYFENENVKEAMSIAYKNYLAVTADRYRLSEEREYIERCKRFIRRSVEYIAAEVEVSKALIDESYKLITAIQHQTKTFNDLMLEPGFTIEVDGIEYSVPMTATCFELVDGTLYNKGDYKADIEDNLELFNIWSKDNHPYHAHHGGFTLTADEYLAALNAWFEASIYYSDFEMSGLDKDDYLDWHCDNVVGEFEGVMLRSCDIISKEDYNNLTEEQYNELRESWAELTVTNDKVILVFIG